MNKKIKEIAFKYHNDYFVKINGNVYFKFKYEPDMYEYAVIRCYQQKDIYGDIHDLVLLELVPIRKRKRRLNNVEKI